MWDNCATSGKKWVKVGSHLTTRTNVLSQSGASEHMFLGSYQHTVDEKGRLTLPAKWRSELAGGVVVTRGLENCLFVYPKSRFEEYARQVELQGIELADARAWARYLGAMAADVEPDKQGRILVPENLRKFARLDGDVVVIGAMSHLEVWNATLYEEANNKIESDAPALAERIGQLMRHAARAAQ